MFKARGMTQIRTKYELATNNGNNLLLNTHTSNNLLVKNAFSVLQSGLWPPMFGDSRSPYYLGFEVCIRRGPICPIVFNRNFPVAE